MNKKLKILLLVVLGLIGACGIATGVVFALTSGMTKTADQFFLAVRAHDVGRARGFLSEEFKASTTEEELSAFLARTALDRFKEAGWSSRSVNNGKGALEGSITTDTGGTIPVTLSFVKENGDWRIYSLRRSPAGLDTRSPTPGVPSRGELVELVKASFRLYAASLKAKDMSAFHAGVSRVWQKQYTVQQMNEVLAGAIRTGNDYTILDQLTPRFEREPTVDEHGVLLVEGDYPEMRPPFTFWMKFVYEGVTWKLMGLGYGMNKPRPTTDANAPNGQTL